MPTLLPLLAVLLAAPVKAADRGLLPEMSRMLDLFDGAGRGAMPLLVPPAKGAVRAERSGPVDSSRWAPVPELPQGAPAARRPGEAQDAFAGLEPCAIVDVVYVRQPSQGEALRSLAPCLEAVSKRYGAAVTAAAGPDGLTLSFVSPASISPLAADLAKALAQRDGRILGHPAKLQKAAARPGATSVLQPVLERCAGPKMLPVTAADFVTVYGDCLVSAKGLGITAVKPDPADPRAVVVYSGARLEALMDMSGTVVVPAAPGAGPFRISAKKDITLAAPAAG